MRFKKGDNIRMKNLIGYLDGKIAQVVKVLPDQERYDVKLLEDCGIWKTGEVLIVHEAQVEEVNRNA